MASDITPEMVEAGIEAWAKAANERLDPEHVMHAALTAALAKIEAGTAEHPDTARLRDLVRAIQKHGDYDTHIAGLLEPFLGGTATAEHPDSVRLREAVALLEDNPMFAIACDLKCADCYCGFKPWDDRRQAFLSTLGDTNGQ